MSSLRDLQSTFSAMKLELDGALEMLELVATMERKKWSVQYNDRVMLWTVQEHHQVVGNIGRGRTLPEALKDAVRSCEPPAEVKL